jgi:DNA-binding transcriptional MocR family regulator
LLEEVPSKRAPLIRDEDRSLDHNLNDLDVGTRARNRAYQERLDDVWRSCRSMEANLKTESKEAMETILDMRDEYKRHLDAFSAALHKDVSTVFDKMDLETLPYEINRTDIIEKALDVFVKKTVPESIERQSGEVSRNLRRAYETFDIEKIKEHKRETKIVEKASRHIKNTAQRYDGSEIM